MSSSSFSSSVKKTSTTINNAVGCNGSVVISGCNLSGDAGDKFMDFIVDSMKRKGTAKAQRNVRVKTERTSVKVEQSGVKTEKVETLKLSKNALPTTTMWKTKDITSQSRYKDMGGGVTTTIYYTSKYYNTKPENMESTQVTLYTFYVDDTKFVWFSDRDGWHINPDIIFYDKSEEYS